MTSGWLMLGVLTSLAVAACGGGAQADGQPPEGVTVVATTTILGDVVASIVEQDAEVVVLAPVGADPHDFQASAAQVAAMNEADLVVANGLFLEEGLEDVLAAAAADGVNVLEIGPLLDPIPFGVVAENQEVSAVVDAPGSDDPHVWFDPIRMAEAAGIIAAELTAVEPSIDWMSRADAYAQELAAADDHISATLSPISDRRLVTNHDSLGYFAERYGFEIVGTVVPSGSTLADPSSEDLAGLIETMRAENVTVLFGETTEPRALADAVAAELGEEVEVVTLYTGSLGEPGSGAETLIGLLTTNAQRIADALAS